MRRLIGSCWIALLATVLAPNAMAGMFSINGPHGGDCAAFFGIWDSETSTCAIPDDLVVDADDELIVVNASVEVGDSTDVHGILRIQPGATLETQTLLSPMLSLLENLGSVTVQHAFFVEGILLNSGALSVSMQTGFVSAGFVINAGAFDITIIAGAIGPTNVGLISNTGSFSIVPASLDNPGQFFNCGGTIMGMISGNQPITDTDTDGDSICDMADCAPGDPVAWRLPDESVADLRVESQGVWATLSWTPVIDDGAGVVVYDVVSSMDPSDFQAVATCIETNDGSDTEAVDMTEPPAGGLIAYLVRPEGTCGLGPVGPADEPRSVTPCPP